ATFPNLSYNVAETITINFTATSLTNVTSGNIVVSAGTADHLVFTTQPGGTSRTGSPLGTQPVVQAQDALGNVSTVGMVANENVILRVSSGSGTLLGTTSLDVSPSGGNGTATFTNVQCSDAGLNKQITASAYGLTNAVSTNFFVGGVERATGGTAISSGSAGGAYTNLTGPAYYEGTTGEPGPGPTT